MRSRVRILGHPVHQSFVVIPAGLLIGSVIFDWSATFFGSAPTWYTAAYRALQAGLVTGVLAIPFGLLDWLKIPQRTRARRIGAVHAIANDLMLVLFAMSWWLRHEADFLAPTLLARLVSVSALLVFGVAAWCGGELVTRHGIGVEVDPPPLGESARDTA